MMPLTIQAIPALNDNYIWAITDVSAKVVLIVDPGDAKPVRAFLQEQGLTLVGILITHHHWDHTNGVAALAAEYKVPVFGPGREKIAALTHPLQDNDSVIVGDFPLRLHALTIPGHTLDHIAYYSRGYVFCGDTLFAAGCGRLFEGTAMQFFTSLQKLAALPDETKIYCAHEYTLSNLHFAAHVEPSNEKIKMRIEQVTAVRQKNLPSLPSTLREEKDTNPFLRCTSAELITQVEKFAGLSLTDPLQVFTQLRRWKDGFKG